jgi:hypothetical protein
MHSVAMTALLLRSSDPTRSADERSAVLLVGVKAFHWGIGDVIWGAAAFLRTKNA